MKKGILILLLGIFSFSSSSAQNTDNLAQDMELLFGELQKSMQHFEQFLNDDMLQQIDSIDFKRFGFDVEELERRLEGKDLDNLSLTDMIDIMHIQMELMEDLDFSQFGDLLQNFGLTAPILTVPPADSEEDEKSSKKKKKRKSYKL